MALILGIANHLVTVCEAEVPEETLPKLRLVGTSSAAVPVPESEMICGLSRALSVIVTLPLSGPLLGPLSVVRCPLLCESGKMGRFFSVSPCLGGEVFGSPP